PSAVRLGRDPRRRARQLVRPVAADGNDPRRRGAHRRAPAGRLSSAPATIWPTLGGRGVNGCTGALQALGTGSPPVARSKPGARNYRCPQLGVEMTAVRLRPWRVTDAEDVAVMIDDEHLGHWSTMRDGLDAWIRAEVAETRGPTRAICLADD